MQEDHHQQKHIAKLRKVALTATERREIRDGLVAYIAYHPVRSLPSAFDTRTAHASRIGWISHHLASLGVGFAAVALLAGGVSYAAESAVPGNSLYPVKVGLTEEVRGWFAFGEEAKATWDIRRVERRLEEAEMLATSGVFSDEARADIASRLETHAKAAASRLGRLASASGEARVAARVSSELESSLRAHERILLSLDGEGDGEERTMTAALEASTSTEDATSSSKQQVVVRAAGLSPLVAQIRLSIDDITSIRIQAEGDASGSIEAAALDDEFSRAAEVLAEARELVEAAEEALKSAATLEARARLDTAEEALGEAEAAIQAEHYADALSLIHTSIRASIEARILARTSAHIDDLGEPVSVTNLSKQGSSTPTQKGQGASMIDVLIDTDVNTDSSTSSGTTTSPTSKSTSTTKSSTTDSTVKIDANTNSAKINTSINVKVNTGGQ